MATPPLSLLWPTARHASEPRRLSDQAVADLHLDDVIKAIAQVTQTPSPRVAARDRFARQILTELVSDPQVITHRQAVLTDLLDNPSASEQLEELLPALEALADVQPGERYRPTVDVGLERVARRLADLELLVATVATLTDVLDKAAVASDGFKTVRNGLEQLRTSPDFAALECELPGLREALSSVRSVVLGVNLAPDLTPESATILELCPTPVEGRRALLFRLLGDSATPQGLTPLQRGERGPLGRPNELVRDLRHLLSEVVEPVQTALQRFARLSTDRVARLGPELAFLLGSARLIRRLNLHGLPTCCPLPMPLEERCAELLDLYDAGLALAPGSSGIVTNDARFDTQSGRVWVLTGPNRGGKTTFTRAVGVAQVLFQAGLYVPCREARLTPVDAIYTHFPTHEQIAPGVGRLDAEAERLASIFRTATPHSLILLNEALSGTSALEALDLARGLVRALRLLGARGMYVTHLHELAAGVDAINASTRGDGTVGSLLAGAETDSSSAERSFRIVPGPPRGKSFAAEIAEQHGISYAQLERLLHARHLA